MSPKPRSRLMTQYVTEQVAQDAAKILEALQIEGTSTVAQIDYSLRSIGELRVRRALEHLQRLNRVGLGDSGYYALTRSGFA